jgi:HNH endonuclease
MRQPFCAACGSTGDLEHHHLVTRAEGGSDDERNLITLCNDCHLKLHERQKNRTYRASERVKAGLAAAKARGVKLGMPRPETATFNDRALAQEAGRRGAATLRMEALRFAEQMRPLLEGELAGLSANAVARALNKRGAQTPKGGTWSARQVLNVRARLFEGR